jgi:hypothetical protein
MSNKVAGIYYVFETRNVARLCNIIVLNNAEKMKCCNREALLKGKDQYK